MPITFLMIGILVFRPQEKGRCDSRKRQGVIDSYDVVRTREDLEGFRKVVRKTFNRIKEVHGEKAEVFVFPAAPAACCIEFGRVWQPKAHRPMEIYDQVKDLGFVHRLRIE